MTRTQLRISRARSRCSLATVHQIRVQLTARRIRQLRDRLEART